MSPQQHIQAWIYPGPPACSAMTELADGRSIDLLKVEYFQLTDMGTLGQITTGCNSYSPGNSALIRTHTHQQFATISGSINGIQSIAVSRSLLTTMITAIITFLKTNLFTGIELDIEDFKWTPIQYAGYKSVIAQIGSALHASGYQLMVDGPAILNSVYQGYYPWKYEDFTNLPVDYIVSMCYDLQDDNGVGTPVSSFSAINDCCQWMLSKVSDPTKIVIGINSYGYHGTPGTYTSKIDTYQQSILYPGFTSAVRDSASGEMMWTNSGVFYDYSDSATLAAKIQTVFATGINAVSIWHLGGNLWPTFPATPTTVTTTTKEDPLLGAFTTRYPGFSRWYAAHFDAQGNYQS